MNGAEAWALIVLALGVVIARRRSVGLALVTAQTVVLASSALAQVPGRSLGFLIAAVVLVMKTILFAVLLVWTLRRTREQRPVLNPLSAPLRLVIAGGLAIALNALVPRIGVANVAVQQGAIALVVLGAAIVLMRRATFIQALGLLVAENGIAYAATSLSGGIPVVIEVGALFDLLIVVAVATIFHESITKALGSGDAGLLDGLRD